MNKNKEKLIEFIKERMRIVNEKYNNFHFDGSDTLKDYVDMSNCLMLFYNNELDTKVEPLRIYMLEFFETRHKKVYNNIIKEMLKEENVDIDKISKGYHEHFSLLEEYKNIYEHVNKIMDGMKYNDDSQKFKTEVYKHSLNELRNIDLEQLKDRLLTQNIKR